MRILIEEMQRNDWKQVRALYGQGLATGMAAFTTTPPKWPSWDSGHLKIGRIVARSAEGDLVGFAALSPVPDT